MTAPVTPSREEMVHGISHLLAGNSFALITGGHHEEVASKIADFVSNRLAAKPADEGAREATIEECAKMADARAARYKTSGGFGRSDEAREIAKDIRALSAPGEPKP
jgi:hypothetical protein